MEKDEDKTKEQLTGELARMRQRITELETSLRKSKQEKSEFKRKQAEDKLRESEKRYRAIVNLGGTIGEAIVLLQDTEQGEGIQKFISDQWPCITGYSREELLGMSFFDLLHPRHRQASLRRHQRKMNREAMPDLFEMSIIRKDGTEVPIELTSAYTTYKGKRANVAFIRDITERKQAEEALRCAEKDWRSSFDSLEDVMIIIDKDYNIENMNESGLALVGKRREEVIGRKCYQVINDRETPGEYCPCPLAMRTKQVESTEHYEESFGKYFSIKSSPVFDENGEIIKFVDLRRDITERKKLEEARQESNDYLLKLTDSMWDAVFSVKMPERVIEWVNDSFKLTGYEPEECVGRTTEFLYPGRDGFLKFGNKLKKAMSSEKDIMHTEQLLKRKSGEVFPAEITVTFRKLEEKIVSITSIVRDISERKQREKQSEFARHMLESANIGRQLNSTIREFVRIIRDYTGCGSVGIRILDSEGNIPYEAYEGFSREFYESESPLSIKSDHGMCINVIKGDTDPGLPFYTEDGSFYMNDTMAFLATVSEEEKGSTQNVCNEYGYESVALVPIRLGSNILGLIHISDTRTDMVPLDLVNTLEDVGPQIGLAIRRLWAEHELVEEKERLEVTLRSTGDGIISVDLESKVTLLNRVAEELTGWTQKEAVGRSIREVFYIIDERNRKPIPDPVENVIKTGRVIGLVNHALLISRDGTERLIADSGAPIHDEQGRLLGVVLVFRDITELQQLREEQLKVIKLESIGTLAGGIAHDFNNLLTGIMGNISLARRYVEPKGKAFERLEEAEKASIRARDLTQQLLTFAKGGQPLRKLINISELIRETATFGLSGSNVRFESFLPDNLWAVEADEGQIGQVIQSIVVNADEAMPSGGTLNISASNEFVKRLGALPLPKGSYVRIDIKDEGIGMSKETLAKIFEPYYTTKQKGSGLGLATTYSIIRNHHGYITAESTPTVGTTFHIYLPASKKRMPRKEKEAAVPPALLGKGRILVMDDEEIIRQLLDDELTSVGYEVELTVDGAEAIEHYRKARESGQPFDAVILDLTIPGGMGGKEAINKLLEIDPNVKAIVSSGYSTDPIMSDFKDYGFSGVVAKPYKVEQLEKTLHSLLKEKK